MDKDNISKYRAEVIERFINIETIINAISCHFYKVITWLEGKRLAS